MLVLGRETGQRNKRGKGGAVHSLCSCSSRTTVWGVEWGPGAGWQGPMPLGRSGQALNCFLFFIPPPPLAAGGV